MLVSKSVFKSNQIVSSLHMYHKEGKFKYFNIFFLGATRTGLFCFRLALAATLPGSDIWSCCGTRKPSSFSHTFEAGSSRRNTARPCARCQRLKTFSFVTDGRV